MPTQQPIADEPASRPIGFETPVAVIAAHLNRQAQLRGITRQRVLHRWALDSLLIRIGSSRYRDDFALKGANLFSVWEGDQIRFTPDLDLHARVPRSASELLQVLAEIAAMKPRVADGLTFDFSRAKADPLLADRHNGHRITVPAQFADARLSIQLDICEGHPVSPGFELRWFPDALGKHYGVALICYPREAMLSEKLSVVVEFGADNTRLRDFYDIWFLTQRYTFQGASVIEAIEETFQYTKADRSLNRDDGYWEAAFQPSFVTPEKQIIWTKWLARHQPLVKPPPFGELVHQVGQFALPILNAARDKAPSPGFWRPAGPWAR